MKQAFSFDQISKQNIFTVPENYFEQLEKNILDKTVYDPKTIHVSFYKRYFGILASGVAASLFIMGLSYYIFKEEANNLSIDAQLNAVSQKDIIQYLQEDDLSMVEYQLSNKNVIQINDKETLYLSNEEYQQVIDWEGME
ncbi:MAG: hypothetical protein KA313_06075 [Pseudarcicella sp.]|nr:hypothetical protein [Pseudarcicella sp.]MBP6410649.1 hypothetical protein [Pseudarcicella sp.]